MPHCCVAVFAWFRASPEFHALAACSDLTVWLGLKLDKWAVYL